MKFEFLDKITDKDIIFVLFEDEKTNKYIEKLNKELDSYLSSILNSIDFQKNPEEVVSTIDPKKFRKIIIINAGNKSSFTDIAAIKIGSKIAKLLKSQKLSEIELYVPAKAAEVAYGIKLKSYKFIKYKSKDNLKNHFDISSINIINEEFSENKKQFEKLNKIAEAIYFARDLITEPANVLYPETIANEVKKNLTKSDIKIEILDKKAIEKLGMNALLGVAQGSSKDPRVVIMHYNGGKKSDKPMAFIGKGVTFDSGGLSLKLSSMEKMKYDMAGAAVIVGTMKALAERKAKINAIGIVGFVENMPDGNAQRPSDVVKTMSGKTVEILNTDAEGRLLLCDLLWYCQDKFNPKLMIDVATLTGAVSIALGNEFAGLFSNNENLATDLLDSSNKVDEKLWRLPLHPSFNKQLESEIADYRNISLVPMSPGSSIAAQFLQNFVNDVPWAHLDIASVAWASDDSSSFHAKGATAFGIRLLNKFVEDNYEK